jgi:hypothetical protein
MLGSPINLKHVGAPAQISSIKLKIYKYLILKNILGFQPRPVKCIRVALRVDLGPGERQGHARFGGTPKRTPRPLRVTVVWLPKRFIDMRKRNTARIRTMHAHLKLVDAHEDTLV